MERSHFCCVRALSVSLVPLASAAVAAGTARRAWTTAFLKHELPRFTKPPPTAAMLRDEGQASFLKGLRRLTKEREAAVQPTLTCMRLNEQAVEHFQTVNDNVCLRAAVPTLCPRSDEAAVCNAAEH